MTQTLEPRRRPQAEPLDIAVVYEDESLVAIDKPPGMVVHPTYKHWTGTLLNALLWRVRDRPDLIPRIITRLDKDTSGLVLVALTPQVHARVQKDAAAGRVRKEYLAIVHGTPWPPQGTIAMPLARSVEDRRRVVVTSDGALSVTRYELVGRVERQGRSESELAWIGGRAFHEDVVTLVRCELVTGRTHQIRVHLAARGWPVLGDAVYGVSDARVSRQALHAWRVSLPHPLSREPLEIEAPPPADLRALLKSAAS